ncbi:putative pyridoxal-dependent decarboxylase domain-containing protein 2 isoform X1 [Ixodes scapularis]
MADSGGDRGVAEGTGDRPTGPTAVLGDTPDHSQAREMEMGASDPKSKDSVEASEGSAKELLDLASNSVDHMESTRTKQWLGGGDEVESRKDVQKHVPGPLQALPLSLEDIRLGLETIVQQQNNGQGPPGKTFSSDGPRRLDEAGKAVVTSHALAAYVSTLELSSLRKLTARVVSDTGLWVSRLFRFFDSAVYFHEESREGLVRVCRLALHAKYPRLSQGDGYEALFARPPVLYLGAHTRASLGHHLCSQLGLPLSCLRMVPQTRTPGRLYQTDLEALEHCLAEDVSQGKIPTLVVASAGSPAVGQVDPLQGLQELCKRHEAWLHVEGHALAALCLVSVPNLPARTGDSVSLPLGTWLGLPSVPYVTLYKTGEAALAHAAGLSSFSVHSKLQCLPLWVGLQSLGHQGLLQRVLHCLRLWLGGGDEVESRKDVQKHVPGPLQALPLSLEDIRLGLETIVQQQNNGQGPPGKTFSSDGPRRLDEAGKAVVTSHALAAYVSTLELSSLRKLTARVVSDTGLWVSRLFRFFDSAVYFHEESREGLVRVCRLALHAKYPRLSQGDGYEALFARPPVLYLGAHTRASLGHHLCSQLGLPLSCLRMVPQTRTPGRLYQTDLEALEHCLAEDVSQGKIPTLVVASAGSPAVGQVDPLQGLQELCKRHEAWLHVEGHALAALCLVSVPNLPARTGDSVSLPLGTWLGLPSVPYVTLYKTGEAALAHAAGLSSFSVHSKLQCLPLWVGLQSLGHQGLLQRVLHCLRLVSCPVCLLS